MLERVDSCIQSKVFQPIADWFHETFDRDTYWIAEKLYVATAISYFVGTGSLMTAWAEAGWSPEYFAKKVMLTVLFGAPTLFVSVMSVNDCRKASSSDRKTKTTMCHSLKGIRLLFITMAFVFSLAAFLSHIGVLPPGLGGDHNTAAEVTSGYSWNVCLAVLISAIWFHTCDVNPVRRVPKAVPSSI